MKALLLILVILPSYAQASERMAPMECVSTNRDGQRMVGRSLGYDNTFQESLYQCYLRSAETSVRSCRVYACRVRGAVAWRRIQ